MSEALSRLRAELHRIAEEGRPSRSRYPAEFRERVLAMAQEQMRLGLAVDQVAAQLGLRVKTLRKWLGPEPQAVWRPVRVETAVAALSARQPVVIVGGIRVEGLDLEGVVDLLRALT